jgi:2-(1,2-epoxy-1,2-dihydrophenyl)acetyl-CoA isomerase
MAAYDAVLIEIAGPVGTVTLNRPEKRNAFDGPMCAELLHALTMLAESDAVRAICITGAGKGFCAGADLNVLAEEGAGLVSAGKDVALAIRNAPKPVLALVNGAAAGGGANLALACDYRIASDQASIGQVFHRLGLGPDWGGSYFLPRLVGTSRALELVWSARMVPATEALVLGLFDRLVPQERLATEGRTLGELWASFPALAVRRAKEAVYQSERRSLVEMLDLEVAHQNELFATPEARRRIGQALSPRSH